jgi:hypothetical protein
MDSAVSVNWIESEQPPSRLGRRAGCSRIPLDGNVLPWPVSIVDFEDLDQFRVIRDDQLADLPDL